MSGDGHGLNAAVKRVEELSILVAALTQDRDDRIAALLRALDGTNAVLSAAYARLRAAQDETSEARAERDRLVAAVRALADEWERVRRPQLRACASDLRALLPTSGPSQVDAEPQHADGEAGTGGIVQEPEGRIMGVEHGPWPTLGGQS